MVLERKERTREVLLEAATKLFGERGYRAVSTRDLAEAAGVNLAAIQYHFGSKAKLFIEVVHSLMEGSGCLASRMQALGPGATQHDAADQLGEFVTGFLSFTLDPQGPRACQVMLREVLTDHSEDPSMLEALVSSVADKFMRPVHDILVSTLTLLAPDCSREELELCADSIIGQCTFYPSHRLFLERLAGPEVLSDAGVRKRAAHITAFSLRALQLPEDVVLRARERVERGDALSAELEDKSGKEETRTA